MRLVRKRKVVIENKIMVFATFQCSKNPLDHIKEMKMSELAELDKLQARTIENSLNPISVQTER